MQAIRAKANNYSADKGDIKDNSDGAEAKKIKFRNYQPYDKSLQKSNEQKTVEVKNADKTAGPSRATQPAEQLEAPQVAKPKDSVDIIKAELAKHQSDDINIVPKKPNWDLKSQVSGKLERLRNRTQKAIVEILREKLAGDIDE